MLYIQLLGGLAATSDDRRPIDFPTRKAAALLAVLARHPGKRHSRQELAALLWPDSGTTDALTSLRQTLMQLRRLLLDPAGEPIITPAGTLALDPARVEVDVVQFECSVGKRTPPAPVRAAELYRGDFLQSFDSPTEPFEEWVRSERMGLREQAVIVLTMLVDGELNHGRAEQGIRAALQLLSIDPLQERIHRLLMRLYLEQGRRGTALEQYRFCCAVLQRELGVAPETATEALYREIRELPAGRHTSSSGAEPQPAIEVVLDRPAVAVLPFTDLSGDPDQRYFTDGLSEDIITTLAGWRRFPLIASSSTLPYGGSSHDIRRVAEDLGVRYIVDGSFRRAGRRARISVRLIEADSGHIRWTQRFDPDLRDILSGSRSVWRISDDAPRPRPRWLIASACVRVSSPVRRTGSRTPTRNATSTSSPACAGSG